MRKALVIDDEVDICLILTAYLGKQQFQTQHAQTVKDGCIKVDNVANDLIFIDLNLPDGSGFDIIDYIKRLKLNSKLIVISAHDHEATRVLASGVDLFVSKPFTIKTISEALKTLSFLPQLSS